MLENLSLRFDPIEDRIALCIQVRQAGQASQSHWLHLTRRLCAAWRRDLQAMVDQSAQAPAQLDAPVRAALSAAHHEAMHPQVLSQREAPLEKPQANQSHWLVTQVQCGRRRSDGRWMLGFDCRDQPRLTLFVRSSVLHGLVEALSRQVAKAGWAIESQPTERKVQPAPAAASQLH